VVSFLVAMAFFMMEFLDQGSEKRTNAYHGDIAKVCGTEVGVDVYR
jgi:hypothetical protein